MNKQEILDVMSESEGCNIEITDVNGKEIVGYVDLYESRFDNSDDDVNAGEASICVDTADDNSYMLYESDIKRIKIIKHL